MASGKVDLDKYVMPTLDQKDPYYDVFVEPSPNVEILDKKLDAVCQPALQEDERNKKYTYWATSYDRDMMYDVHYRAMPICCAEGLDQVKPKIAKNARIADFAAGTGLCGMELNKLGYTNIDAIDGCQALLVEAKKKGVYTNFFVGCIGGVPIPDLESNAYDALVVCGSVYAGHFQADWLIEIIRVLKPGAPFVMQSSIMGGTVDRMRIYLGEVEKVFKEYCDKGIIERVKYTEEEIKGTMIIYTYRKLKDIE